MAAALVRQNMMVTISDKEGLIRKGGWIVARPTRSVPQTWGPTARPWTLTGSPQPAGCSRRHCHSEGPVQPNDAFFAEDVARGRPA